MPTPILKIPVDDAAFQRYLRTFQKYQDQLADQPDMWKDVNDATKGAALAGAAMAAEIAHQTDELSKLTAEEEKREKKLREAAKEREREAREQEKRDDDAKKRRQHAVQQVKDYAKNLADAAISMGKWTVMGGAFGMVSSALGLWGLDRMAQGNADLLKTSSGMGVSMSQNQGANLTMSRYYDVNSTIGNVANMQASPSQWGTFKMMGINNPRSMDPAELTYQASIAARRMYRQYGGNKDILDAMGVTNMFSMESMRTMSSDPDFNKTVKQGREYQGLNDEVGRKWRSFALVMDNAKLKVENTLITGLTQTTGPLGSVVQGLEKLADTLLSHIDWKAISEDIESFADKINSGEFKKSVDEFVDDISLTAKYLSESLPGLKNFWDFWFGDPLTADWWKNRLSSDSKEKDWAGRDMSTEGNSGGGSAGVKAPANSQESNWLGRHLMMFGGFTKAQAEGGLTNILAESGGDPFAWGDYDKKLGRKTAYGIGQWHADRRGDFFDHSQELFGYKHTMESVKDRKRALDEQIRFMEWEYKNTRRSAGDHLRGATNKADAAYIVSREYEGARGTSGDRSGRTEATYRSHSAASVTIKVEAPPGHSVNTTTNAAAGR